ncbi:hypothetical protein [Brenneria roseae]|nr:hypothetical protein [Brenneria roseae]
MLIPPPYLPATGNEIESLVLTMPVTVTLYQRLMGTSACDAIGINAKPA